MPTVTPERLDDILVHNETRGRRYGSDGRLIRSPKGALGEFQVMPATARDPGYGLKPADPNNPDDLARLGREYRRKMQSLFGNNLPKMYGAYNAGPGRMQELIAQYGEDWLQYAPAETRKYVRDNMAMVRGR